MHDRAMLWAALLFVFALAASTLVLWQRQRRLQAQLDNLREDAIAHLAQERRQAAEEERSRLLDDLHDDVGAKLLSLIHVLETPAHADLARAVMQDFRDIVSRSHQEACTLLQALGEIREETEARLDAMGSSLDWQQHPDTPDPDMDEQQTLHLFRIAREAVTNAVRHGHATLVRMRVRAVGGELLFDVTDDGPGLPDRATAGRGIAGMRHRAEALRGSIDWTPGTLGGTKVILRFPLPAAGL
jgi:signal transduction histidine kinase